MRFNFFIFTVYLICHIWSVQVSADSNNISLPCSGKKGGIAYCDDSDRFMCKDGSVSQSKKSCSGFNGQNGLSEQANHLAATFNNYLFPAAAYTLKQSLVGLIKDKNIKNSGLPENLVSQPISNSTGVIKREFPGFTIWEDCSKRAPIKFSYIARRDTGNSPRYSEFYLDPQIPANCQQYTANVYGHGYDRGHLVPANHFDDSFEAIKATNAMTNILPQAADMNRGAWFLTEEITDCYRDISDILVIGGVFWTDDHSKDFFIKSHGIYTPSAFWKILIRGSENNQHVIAWIVPNSQDAVKENLDKYLVTPGLIERITGEKLPIADYNRNDKPDSSWVLPIDCNQS